MGSKAHRGGVAQAWPAALALTLCLTIAMACLGASGPAAAEAANLRAQGIIDYVYFCAGCHGANGEGSQHRHVPALAGRSSQLLASEISSLQARTPGGDGPPGRQPAHSPHQRALAQLSAAQIQAIAAYLASLAPPPAAAIE